MIKKMSLAEARGKLKVLEQAKAEMDSLMDGTMKDKKSKGMAQVEIMSNSPKGMAEGAKIVEDMFEGAEESKSGVTLPKFGSKQECGAMMDEDEYEEDSMSDESEDESEEESEEELDKKIAKLLAQKKSKQKKQI